MLMQLRESRRGRVAVVLVGAALLLLLFLLFRGEDVQPAAPIDVADLPRVDGTLMVVEDDRLVMRPFEPLDGRDEVTFEIRDAYRDNFDMAHMRSHSSVGIPTRIYFRRDGDTYIAVWKDDAPANRGRS